MLNVRQGIFRIGNIFLKGVLPPPPPRHVAWPEENPPSEKSMLLLASCVFATNLSVYLYVGVEKL